MVCVHDQIKQKQRNIKVVGEVIKSFKELSMHMKEKKKKNQERHGSAEQRKRRKKKRKKQCGSRCRNKERKIKREQAAVRQLE